jgi:hypothetical protein
MIFSSHHDAPVAFPDSMRVLDATVTRLARGSGRIVGPDQRVDVITALKAMTLWPAYHHFEEATKGSLEPGKLADFAVLSQDPTAVEPTTIADLKVTETIKEGVTVFRLTAEEERKAERMLHPGRDGRDVFARFLTAAAASRDLAQLPSFARRPVALAQLTKAPHDNACVAGVLGDLVQAMVQAEEAPAGQ